MRDSVKPRELWYFCHRYTEDGTASPERQAENLNRAASRALSLGTSWAVDHPERLLWLPWLSMAVAGISEDKAWRVIESCIKASDGVVIDLDGAEKPDGGMFREGIIAQHNGVIVESTP